MTLGDALALIAFMLLGIWLARLGNENQRDEVERLRAEVVRLRGRVKQQEAKR